MAISNYNATINQFRNPNNITGITSGDIVSKGLFLDKTYDQPTYLTFKLMFGYLGDQSYNLVNGALNSGAYDRMPHPLFNPNDKFQSSATSTNRAGVIPNSATEVTLYSAINYLRSANEPTRAEMLKYFISLFNDLQYNNQWYFQSVSGINELLKVDPKRGIRVDDSKILTIKCLEALDLRISYLLNLYKKIAWDDTYQRWVLPDMMRYFTLKIYVTELRTFHKPFADPQGNKDVAPGTPVFLKALDGFVPTYVITCEQCEFDISDLGNSALQTLSVGPDSLTETSVEFKIKVGQVYETQMYPMFKNIYLNDIRLNGLYRSREDVDTTDPLINTNYNFVTDNQIAQGLSNTNNTHRAGGYPSNGNLNDNGTTASDDENIKNTPYQTLSFDEQQQQNNTFIGNFEKTGTAFVKNTVKSAVDKAKMTPIEGVSYNEVESAIASKDIFSLADLTKRAISNVLAQTVKPSELLVVEKILSAISPYNIVENFAEAFNSAATKLNPNGTTQQTSIISGLEGEVKSETKGDKSQATDLTGNTNTLKPTQIIITAPPSQSTINKITSK